MKVETPLISILLCGLMFVGMFTFAVNLLDENDISYNFDPYDTENGTRFSVAFDKVNQTKADIDEMVGVFESETSEDTGSLFAFLTLGKAIGRHIMTSLTVMKDLFNVFTDVLGIPALFSRVFFAIILITILIAIVMFLLGRTQ